jgi:phosphate:Na+ symporter
MQLHGDLTRIPPGVAGEQAPEGFTAGAQALAAWLGATEDQEAAPDPGVLVALAEASRRLSIECKTARDRTLENLALQRTPAATARGDLETLAWSDGTLYHAWHLAESLRIASGK